MAPTTTGKYGEQADERPLMMYESVPLEALPAAHDERGEMASRGASESRTASVASCVMNLSKTVVGAGTLGLPAAFASVGPRLGVALLVVFGALSAFGLHLLAAAARLTRNEEKSFRALAVTASPRFATVIDAAVAVKCFGVATSYLVVIGDTAPQVAEGNHVRGALSRRWPWITLSVVVLTPLCLLEKLDGLKVTSAASMVLVLVLTGCMLAYCLQERSASAIGDALDRELSFDLDAAKTLTVFIFGYTCHQNIFAICNELERPTQARVDGIVLATIGLACGVYLVVALAGFTAFRGHVQGDVLDNFGDTSFLGAVRVVVAVLVALSYPLQSHPARACVFSLLDAKKTRRPGGGGLLGGKRTTPEEPALLSDDASYSDCDGNSAAEDDDDDVEVVLQQQQRQLKGGASSYAKSRKARVITTLCFLAASLAVALTVQNLTTVLAVVGATGSTTVSYIVPGGVYYLLAPPSVKRSCALGLFLLGVLIMPIALVLTFL